MTSFLFCQIAVCLVFLNSWKTQVRLLSYILYSSHCRSNGLFLAEALTATVLLFLRLAKAQIKAHGAWRLKAAPV